MRQPGGSSINNKAMAYVIADNIISSLGLTSEANYAAVATGRSGLRPHAAHPSGVPQAFVASIVDDEIVDGLAESGLSRFESLALASARKAVEASGINPSGSDVVFILSTTKGSIEQMPHHTGHCPWLGDSAVTVARRLGISTSPIVVSNACISGVSALILASRLLQQHSFRYAVVCGADSPGRFIVSGFQSLKALSAEPCRPFDMERTGLNLGEAAATMVLAREAEPGSWCLTAGSVRNDAYHISTPSKTASGLYSALQSALKGMDVGDIAFINAHGTATLFNDQMESVAIERAGLSTIPVNAVKGYFGHTLGAAGILETIISIKAADHGLILGTKGFEELGVSGKINISPSHGHAQCHCFVKTISGFGGCNASLYVSKHELTGGAAKEWHVRHTVVVRPGMVMVDGRHLDVPSQAEGADFLTGLYKSLVGNYPKFYKMDALCRLGFVASELLLKAEGSQGRYSGTDHRAVLLFNRTSSVQADRAYLKSIDNDADCFPSPLAFVYTLPNIVAGEIAIRNGYMGETALYVLPGKDSDVMARVFSASCADEATESAITGWLDYEDACHYEAELSIVENLKKET